MRLGNKSETEFSKSEVRVGAERTGPEINYTLLWVSPAKLCGQPRPDKAQSSPPITGVQLMRKLWERGGGEVSPLTSKGLGIAPAEPGILPQAQSSSKAVIKRGQKLGLKVEGKSLLAPGLGEPETTLGQEMSGLGRWRNVQNFHESSPPYPQCREHVICAQ